LSTRRVLGKNLIREVVSTFNRLYREFNADADLPPEDTDVMIFIAGKHINTSENEYSTECYTMIIGESCSGELLEMLGAATGRVIERHCERVGVGPVIPG